MTEQEEYILKIDKEIGLAELSGKAGLFKISEKVSDSIVYYLIDYLKNKYPDFLVETKKCLSCVNTWDILIFF
jgi:hypothetical protein